MSLLEPTGPGRPSYTVAVRHPPITGNNALTLGIRHFAGDESTPDGDAIIQKVVDALAGAGFEVLEATKEYGFRQTITITPTG